MRAKRTQLAPVSPPLNKEDQEVFNENPYARRPRVGGPSIGVPNRVSTVGLRGLKVETIYGNQPDV